MKAKIVLAAAVVIPLGILSSERIFAQACAPFPLGVVPFAMVHYISKANIYGDRFVVGELGGRLKKDQIPLPAFANQRFCGPVELAPGLSMEAYVPSGGERAYYGSFVPSTPFVAFSPHTWWFDTNYGEFDWDTFPGNLIPPLQIVDQEDGSLYGFHVWRIPPSAFTATLSVPILISLAGANNSYYTSELTLTNRSAKDVPLEFNYTAAFGEGSGNVTDILPAGQQRIEPDAIAYLRSLGLPVPTSVNVGGTLAVKASGLVSPHDVAVSVRTTTALPEGRAGLAYMGNSTWKTFNGVKTFLDGLDSPYICGLRQNASDRSHVAVMHAGTPEDGPIVLRLIVTSGIPPFISQRLPEVTLAPGGFHQVNEVLISNGLSLSNGYVRVERVSGKAPFYAYGLINDQLNSDGSFVPPLVPTGGGPETRLTIPVMAETAGYASELVLTNASGRQQKLDLSFVAEGIQAQSHRAKSSIDLAIGQQLILPNFVQSLRDQGIPGIGSAGTNYVGALFVSIQGDWDGNDGRGVFIAARTSARSNSGGQFGVFYPAVPFQPDRIATTTAWVYGLQQNSDTRTNLALVDAGSSLGEPNTFRIELFDGPSGTSVSTVEGITLPPQGWLQFESVLQRFAPGTTNGYARVTRTAGKNGFIAYAVVNDGGLPGQRTGDGAFLPMQLDIPVPPNRAGFGYWDY